MRVIRGVVKGKDESLASFWDSNYGQSVVKGQYLETNFRKFFSIFALTTKLFNEEDARMMALLLLVTAKQLVSQKSKSPSNAVSATRTIKRYKTSSKQRKAHNQERNIRQLRPTGALKYLPRTIKNAYANCARASNNAAQFAPFDSTAENKNRSHSRATATK